MELNIRFGGRDDVRPEEVVCSRSELVRKPPVTVPIAEEFLTLRQIISQITRVASSFRRSLREQEPVHRSVESLEDLSVWEAGFAGIARFSISKGSFRSRSQKETRNRLRCQSQQRQAVAPSEGEHGRGSV